MCAFVCVVCVCRVCHVCVCVCVMCVMCVSCVFRVCSVCVPCLFRMCFVCVSFVFHVCFVCAYVAVSVCAFQWRSYYGLKYSTNLPIILVFKVCIFCRQRNAFITSEIPMTLVDIHDVAFVSLCFRKDTRISK